MARNTETFEAYGEAGKSAEATELVMVGPEGSSESPTNLSVNRKIGAATLRGADLEKAAIEVFRVAGSPTGLELPEDTPKEIALQLHAELGLRRAANYWHWVDLMEFCGRKYGETYDMVSQWTGWTYQRAAQIHSIGKQFRREDRILGMVFSHYEEVSRESALSYDDRITALKISAERRNSCSGTRALVQEMLRQRGIETKRPRSVGKAMVNEGADAGAVIDSQAQVIREQQEEIERLNASADAVEIETEFLDDASAAVPVTVEPTAPIGDTLTDEDIDAAFRETDWQREDEYAALRERIDLLTAENAKLRDDVANWDLQAGPKAKVSPLDLAQIETYEARIVELEGVLAGTEVINVIESPWGVMVRLSEHDSAVAEACRAHHSKKTGSEWTLGGFIGFVMVKWSGMQKVKLPEKGAPTETVEAVEASAEEGVGPTD